MTKYVCALSGEAAEVPVVSPRSGEIFEKRLIVKFIEENGTDPLNNEKLDVLDLVEIKNDLAARALHRSLNSASMPSLLKTLQDEWDACILSNFTLRQELKTAREELTHALYQNDAACRVINRLSSELQAARQILATLPHGKHITGAAGDVMEVEEQQEVDDGLPGIAESVANRFQEIASQLSTARKQRGKALPEGLATVDQLQAYKETAAHNGIHSASVPGITCLDLQKEFAVTGGMDKTVVLFNTVNETIESTFKGHQKKISSVILHPNCETIISGSQDATVRIWKKEQEGARQVIDVHEKAVTDISLHPSGDFVLCGSDDAYWSLVDLNVGRALTKVKSDNESTDAGISSIQFHPDGLIFGIGSKDSVVKIWDIKDQVKVANFPGHQGNVRAISFSENGYYLATGADDGEVKIWDLRKLKNIKTLSINDGKYPLNALTFDQSGSYLAIAGNDLQIVHVKSWSIVARFDDNSQPISGVRFGADANYVVSTSLDKNLRLYSLKA